jgi:hypothetical protein
MARRLLALVVMLPISGLVMAAYLCEALGLFDAAERIDLWTTPRIEALLRWADGGHA